VEVKMDNEMTSTDVQAKREAAESVDATWRYLLVSESDVEMAKGSWRALERLGG
jgi:type III restriction enzyme